MATLRPGQFSIIIPVKAYNAYCQESLAACRRLYPDQELLFCPDAAPDLALPGVRVLPSGPVGPGAKRDLCAASARGEFLAFLDDDAYPAAGWLEAAVEVFADGEVGAVGGPAVTPADDPVERWASGLVYESVLVGGPFAFRYRPLAARDCDDYPTCNLLVRRSVFEAIGGFDTRYWPGEDTVACLKIVHELKKRIAYDPRVLVYHHRRDMFAAHLRQLNRYARHRGFFVKRFPKTSLRPSYFAPTALLAWFLLGWLPAAPCPAWLGWWAASLGLYALAALLEAARLALGAPKDRRGLRLWLLTAGGLAATHLSYGWNLMVGLLSSRMTEERSAMTGTAA
ncbi:MAG TPA: glycosyltransferase [bacterium]|jgi:GT2 family glycosyltransferase|nr:glycosyltransferase [bacterium]